MKNIRNFILGLVLVASPSFAQTGNVEGLNVGNVAPEIALPNPADSIIKLSSLRGKMVLIDFWASWCGPCRMENPHVVKAYNKYKDEVFVNGVGFTVYSVSLDRPGGKEAWKNAIAKDSLKWPYHVSDLQWWNSAAAQRYQVFSIPTNYLIDGNGVIIAKGLRGEQLTKALDTQLEKDPKEIKRKRKEAKEKDKQKPAPAPAKKDQPFGPARKADPAEIKE